MNAGGESKILSEFESKRNILDRMLDSNKTLLYELEQVCTPFLAPGGLDKKGSVEQEKEERIKVEAPLLIKMSYWISELEGLEKQTRSIIERLVR